MSILGDLDNEEKSEIGGGIFGMMDAANIPTNPFFIEKGTYHGEVTASEYRFKKDESKYIFIELKIEEEDSEFNNRRAQLRFDLPDPTMTPADFNILPNAQKAKIRNNLAGIKRTLCGDERNKGLGLPISALNDDDLDLGALKGTKVVFGVSNFGDGKVQVRWVNMDKDYYEDLD